MLKELAVVFTIFSKELFGIPLGGTTVDVYIIAIAGFGLITWFNPGRLFPLIAALFGILLTSSIILLSKNAEFTATFYRQAAVAVYLFVGIGAYLTSCSEIKLLAAYLEVCFWMAVLGIIQVALSLMGYDVLICVHGRLDSLTYEPSHYVVAIGPCAYYGFRYARSSSAKLRSAVVLVSLLLTACGTMVPVLAVCFALACFRQARVAVAVMLLAVSPLLLSVIPADAIPKQISSRFVAMGEYLSDAENPWDTYNLTVLSFATNLDVAIEAVRDGRWYGNGFCGHSEAYHRHYEGTAFVNHRSYTLNIRAAHCLGIRILSEFGVLGAAFTFWVIWYFLIKRRRDIWCMFLLITFVARVLKLGSWLDYGLPLYILWALKYYIPDQSAVAATSQRQRAEFAMKGSVRAAV